MEGALTMSKNISNETEITFSSFAEAMSALQFTLIDNGKSEYANCVQSMLCVLCEDLEEKVDIVDCLQIIHNTYMLIASHNEDYHKKIGDIIEGIARKENEVCSEEKD